MFPPLLDFRLRAECSSFTRDSSKGAFLFLLVLRMDLGSSALRVACLVCFSADAECSVLLDFFAAVQRFLLCQFSERIEYE